MKNCNGNTSRPNCEGEAFLSYREIGPSALAKEISPLRVLDIEVKITSQEFVSVLLETSHLKRMLSDIRIVA